MSFRAFVSAAATLTLLVLLTFFGLQQLHMSTGSLIDWLVGIGIFWWLAGVTILPWNTHFAARDFIEEANLSQEKGIVVAPESVEFARRVAARFKGLAIGLHLLSAGVLFVLARYQLIAVGYPAAIAALALTLLRPAQRAYEYLSRRLNLMAHQIHYPREDVVELRDRVTTLENSLLQLRELLDADKPESWAYKQEQQQAVTGRQLDRLAGRVEELAQQNTRDHEQLARHSTSEIARLSEDARFLNQVRELIHFVRTA